MSAFKKDLTDLRSKYSLLKYRDCTPEENEKYRQIFKTDIDSLPPNIVVKSTYDNNNGLEYIFRHNENRTDITLEERIEYLQLKQTEHLNSIRKMLLFFVVLTCISLAIGVLIALSTLSQ